MCQIRTNITAVIQKIISVSIRNFPCKFFFCYYSVKFESKPVSVLTNGSRSKSVPQANSNSYEQAVTNGIFQKLWPDLQNIL